MNQIQELTAHITALQLVVGVLIEKAPQSTLARIEEVAQGYQDLSLNSRIPDEATAAVAAHIESMLGPARG